MTAVYDPLVDPTSDGYAKVLDAANAEPLASDAERSSFWRMVLAGAAWVAGVLALGLCLGFGILHYGRQHLAHQAKVSAIQNPPSGSPQIGASPKNIGLGYGKSHIPNKTFNKAIENIAAKAINTPDTPSFEAVKPITKESSADDPLAPALAEFDQLVRNFESKL